MRRASLLVVLILLGAATAGCGLTAAERCVPSERYASAGSEPPLRIPDDLAPPDETDALRIPLESEPATTDARPGYCIESPPPYQSTPPAGG